MRVVIAGYGARVFDERRKTDVVVRSVVVGHGDTVTHVGPADGACYTIAVYTYIVTVEGGGIAG